MDERPYFLEAELIGTKHEEIKLWYYSKPQMVMN